MNEYELLSIIYRILGETSLNTFEKIERNKSQPKEIRSILNKLKHAKALMDKKHGEEERQIKVERKSLTDLKIQGYKQWSQMSLNYWDTLKNYLKDKKFKISNIELVDAFKTSGMKSKARSKEGRPKILLVLKEELNNLDDKKREFILNSVLKKLGFSQTKGYMEAIRSENTKS